MGGSCDDSEDVGTCTFPAYLTTKNREVAELMGLTAAPGKERGNGSLSPVLLTVTFGCGNFDYVVLVHIKHTYVIVT